MPGTRLAFTGPAARKATRSRAKGPPNSSTTALSRSSSHTETATKPSSKRNGILLQQPASRPGGDASVPYGGVFQSLNEAQQDALNRCSLTNLAQEGWGPCRT